MRAVTGVIFLMLSFMTTFPASTRGFAIMMVVTLFIISVIMPVVIYVREVISVFLNISPVMVVSLMYESIIQAVTENIFILFFQLLKTYVLNNLTNHKM